MPVIDRPQVATAPNRWTLPVLYSLFFGSGFAALLYQVVWQRMLGLFSGSDVRSVTIVIAAYLLGLGLGSLIASLFSDRLSSARSVQVYAWFNLGIALFAVLSRFLFYDLLFQRLQFLAASTGIALGIVFISLLIPTVLMGASLPLLARAISRNLDRAAAQIGLLYGVNTLGSGLATLIVGWYVIGTYGYETTVYLGAILSTFVGVVALGLARQFDSSDRPQPQSVKSEIDRSDQSTTHLLAQWCLLVFLSGFAAISLEILWFRVLETVLQSIAYTYAHLLAFILVGNALGSLIGARVVQFIRQPRRVFLLIQASVALYSAIAIWSISWYWQTHPPNLQEEIGYIDLDQITATVVVKYLVLPLIMMGLPNLLLGFYFPLVQQAVQTNANTIGYRVGLIQLANILGNTAGSLFTGLWFLNAIGTAGSLRLLAVLGLGFALLAGVHWRKPLSGFLAIGLAVTIVAFPANSRLWAALHGIQPEQYFLTGEDSTGVAVITEVNDQGTSKGTLIASGQVQAQFPYMHVHALLGSIPALLHPNPAEVMIIGLGSGGTAHTVGVNPLTQNVGVVELLGAEVRILREYANRPSGQPLHFLFHDPRYQFTIGDGRRELELSDRQFDIVEADAIQPWRSRAGMLYSQEFFQSVQAHLKPGGIFVEWNVGRGIAQTFRSVFPYVMQLAMSQDLYVLVGSDRPVEFDRAKLLNRLADPAVVNFLQNAQVNIAAIRTDVETAKVELYSHAADGQPTPVNTDLFPRSEYYLNYPQ